MQRTCAVCGKAYEAKRSTSLYCGGTCRTRATRAGTSSSRVTPIRPEPAASPADGAAERLRAELVAAGREDTTLGQVALGLAVRFDRSVGGADTGSALASLARQLDAARTAALRGVGEAASAVTQHRDELAKRRASRGA